MYCAGCAITPYCSERCQRRDWGDRHRDVCHNLARLEKGESKNRPEPVVPEPESVVPPAAPLRRPNIKRDPPQQVEDRPKSTKFIPPGEKADAYQAVAKNKPSPVRTNRNNFNNNKQEMRRPKNDSFLGDETWESKVQAAQEASPITPQPSQTNQPKKPEPQSPIAAKPSGATRKEAQNNVKPEDLLSHVKPKQKIEKPIDFEKTMDGPTKVASVKVEPANYLVETLPIGESFLASVESPASECGSKQPGFVCVTMHQNFEETFNILCMDYTKDCEAQTGNVRMSGGVLVSYLSEADGGWYRARCLTETRAALIDAARLADITPAVCKPMLQQYIAYPEFCAVIHAKGVKTGANILCTIKSKTESGFKVSIVDTDSGTDLGEGEISRWIPEVKLPAQVPAVGSPAIPSVARPDVVGAARVVLLDVTSLYRAAVRPASTVEDFDAILHTVALHGIKATPLTEPPKPGQLVIAKYTDGAHYRALVKRTKAAVKYLIEYIEYGNEEVITSLDRLYPCPEEFNLTNMPALATIVSLSDTPTPALTKPAQEYIDKLKDREEMILTIPSGEKTAPSGSLVHLTLAKNKEFVNKKLEEMCTPDWKKLQERGGDVLEIAPLMYADLKNAELPLDREFTLEISDFGSLKVGGLSGYEKGYPLAEVIYGPLTDKMNKYCESDLCKEPYLPRPEELCITKYPPYPQWFRAVLIELTGGPGSEEARVLYLDYGNVGTVPVKDLRKMLPEFVEGYPALANSIEIANFPKQPTDAQLCLAVEMININEEGRGSLRVNKIRREDQSCIYTIEVPDFIAALQSLE